VRIKARKLSYAALISDIVIYRNKEEGVILASFVDNFLIIAKIAKAANKFKR
jgi:hypothetical protein